MIHVTIYGNPPPGPHYASWNGPGTGGTFAIESYEVREKEFGYHVKLVRGNGTAIYLAANIVTLPSATHVESVS